MTALSALLAIEHDTGVKLVLDPRIFVQPKDRDPRTELMRQAKWISAMNKTAVLAYAIPNGTHIATRYGRNKADREGRYAGFPDTGAVWPGVTAYLEWKDGAGDASQSQIACLNRLVEMGHPCAVVRTLDGANGWLRSLEAPVA